MITLTRLFETPESQPTSLEEGRGMLGRVDVVRISLKVSKVHTTEDQRRDSKLSSHVQRRDANSCDHKDHMIC